MFITARKRSLRQGYIFAPVCHSVQRGDVRGCWQGVCMVAGGGHVWLLVGGCAWLLAGGVCGCWWAGVHGCWRGVCVIAGGGACVVAGGACMAAGGRACIGYDEIWSMSGQYASYWNAFLYIRLYSTLWCNMKP